MKRWTVLLAALALAMILAAPAWANGSVTYDGAAEEFIFKPGTAQSPTSLFENFLDVMPGDVRTETVELRNSRRSDTDVRVYMRSLGAQEQTDAFLSQLMLTVRQADDSALFDAPANETAQLGDWVYLGTIHPGGSARLEVSLTVPIELDDAWQNQIGYIDWQFKVEEIPAPAATPGTGDVGHTALWAASAVAALSALAFVLRRKTA